jgi:hypothetical protein
MVYYYYINSNNKKDGPHDLVTVMRRIRSGIIIPDTLVCQEEDEAVPAYSISELSNFFNNPIEDIRNELETSHTISIAKILRKGWQFTTEHQGIPVFAGGILLFSWMFGLLVNEILHKTGSGITASFIMFLFLQSCFFAISLRLYRGQKTDLNFLEYTMAPIIAKIAFSSVLFSFIIIAGLPLLAIPSIIAMLILAYIPMFILDYNHSVKQTIISIFLLIRKLDKISLMKLCCITLFYMVCVAFIIPIPIILPIMAGSLCSIYEDLSTG